MEARVKKLIDDLCSMAEGVLPDVIEEFRDKRVNWELREQMQALPDHLICNLWLLRDPQIDSALECCYFCKRVIAVDRANLIVAHRFCVVCWLRAGAPGTDDLSVMIDGQQLTMKEADEYDLAKGDDGHSSN